MTMNAKETLSVQLERLRAIMAMIEVTPAGQRHDELIEKARVAIAAVRESRAVLARSGGRAGTVDATQGCASDFVSASK